MPCDYLYTPQDLLEAHAAWKANCGPGALAAALGVPVQQLRDAFPSFPTRPWTTPTSMQAALTARRAAFRASAGFDSSAQRALLYVQLRGRWDSAPERVQYRHTHWVATAGVDSFRRVYDVNAGDAGGWLTAEVWRNTVLRDIVARKPGASGLWRVRLTLELLPGGAR